MENRERDNKMSRNSEPTSSSGDLNRKSSSQTGRQNSDSSADFGQNIGRSENLNEPKSRGSNVDSGYEGSSNRKPSDEWDRNKSSSTGKNSSGSEH